MTRRDSAQLTEEKNSESTVVKSLQLSHKALSDVSYLKGFSNLERLDLSSNNLNTLEGLRSCTNLKWLSVVQNKLQSLKGIEELCKLTVLNAGRNKLRSMDEVRSLINLRALILNDNEITSICRLDQLKYLNTLVLSRNPIHEIGDSLLKVKSITKLSLSNCQVGAIGSSLKDCMDLKEVRLAHNEILKLPPDLAFNVKIQNLDLGNNLIQSLSDIKVISSLHDLKNLNLQGNPFSGKDKLPKKIKKLVPNLQIFNGKPTERDKVNGKISKKDVSTYHIDESSQEKSDLEVAADENRKKPKASKGLKKDALNRGKDNDVSPSKSFEHAMKKEGDEDVNRRKPNNTGESELEVIDDGETPFVEIISSSAENVMDRGQKKRDHEAAKDVKSLSGVVSVSSKKRKMGKGMGMGGLAFQLLPPASEVGMGGPSTWDA